MSFRLKTILGIALIEALLLALLIFSVLGQLRDSHQHQLSDRAATTATLFATLAKEAVLAMDLASIESLTREILHNPDLRYARVIDGEGRPLAAAGTPALLDRPFSDDRTIEDATDGIFDTYAELRAGGLYYGRVEIGLSVAAMQHTLRQVRNKSLTIAAAEMLLVALFSFVLGSYLTRQLKGLTDASHAITHGKLGATVPVSGSDELADTARTFNRMSEALAEDIARRDAILNAAFDAIITTDAHGRVIEFNRAAETIFGLDRSEALEHSLGYTLFAPEPSREIEAMLRTFRDSGELPAPPPHSELNARRADGSHFPAEVSFSAIHAGDRPLVTLYLRDISQRKQTETGLRTLSTAVEQSPLSIVITDLAGNIEYVNPRFSELTGYTLEEVKGRNPRVLKSGRNQPELYGELWETIIGGGVWHGELLNRKKGGELFWEAAAICPVRMESGEISHYLAIKEDITQRKRMINELEQAKELAESANQAKSEFLATMSHEIRTPMNAILGMGELLADSSLDDEQRHYLEVLNHGGKSLLELIDDILDLSRIEANRLELTPEPFDLHELVEGVTQVLGVRAGQKGLTLEAETAEGIPRYLIGDAKRLRQVLVNLVGNAIKFTHSGGITVRVERFGDDQPLTLQFAVEDSGIGISEEKQVTIFDPFTQADGSVTRDYGGTGLGLSISTKLAELMGGCLWVTSEEDQGSTFAFTATFTLPRQPLAGDTREVDFSNRTVALIGCETLTQEVSRGALAPLGARLELIEACELETALADRVAVEGEHWAALVIEHRIPQADGFTFVEQLRRLEEQWGRAGQPLPVVMISPWRRHEDHDRAHALAMRLLPTPPAPGQLVKALAAILGTTAPRRSRPPAPPSSSEAGVNILLAEDSPDNSLLIETHLRKAGHRLEVVRDGRQAVAAFEEGAFELILMDIQMPIMDGYSATRAIRELEAERTLPPIPIIALTAHALREDEERSLAAGCDGHVTKPVKRRELLEAVERFRMADDGS